LDFHERFTQKPPKSNFTGSRPVGARLIGYMWTDGRTDMAKLIGALSD